jgi:hypothetical protein
MPVRRKTISRRAGIVCLVLVLAMVIAFAMGSIRPALPGEWRTIAIGMSRDEVHDRIPDTLNDMRELKGFDIAGREYMQWGIRRCRWQLKVTYDQQGLVRTVETSFTDPDCGLYNTRWESVD